MDSTSGDAGKIFGRSVVAGAGATFGYLGATRLTQVCCPGPAQNTYGSEMAANAAAVSPPLPLLSIPPANNEIPR